MVSCFKYFFLQFCIILRDEEYVYIVLRYALEYTSSFPNCCSHKRKISENGDANSVGQHKWKNVLF